MKLFKVMVFILGKYLAKYLGSATVGRVGDSNSTNYLHIRFKRDLECFKFVFECNLECADFRMFTNFSISRKRE